MDDDDGRGRSPAYTTPQSRRGKPKKKRRRWASLTEEEIGHAVMEAAARATAEAWAAMLGGGTDSGGWPGSCSPLATATAPYLAVATPAAGTPCRQLMPSVAEVGPAGPRGRCPRSPLVAPTAAPPPNSGPLELELPPGAIQHRNGASWAAGGGGESERTRRGGRRRGGRGSLPMESKEPAPSKQVTNGHHVTNGGDVHAPDGPCDSASGGSNSHQRLAGGTANLECPGAGKVSGSDQRGSGGLVQAATNLTRSPQLAPPSAPGPAVGRADVSEVKQCAIDEAASSGVGLQRPAPNGWMTVWVGERPSRMAIVKREVIEADGFRVRVFKSAGRCYTVLSKQPQLHSRAVLVVTATESERMLAFLRGRGPADMHLVVDVEGQHEKDTQAMASRLNTADGCDAKSVCSWSFSFCWADTLAALRRAVASPAGGGLVQAKLPDSAPTAGSTVAAPAPAATLGIDKDVTAIAGGSTEECGGAGAEEVAGEEPKPWTLLWVSGVAYKPEGTAWREQLEALGCRVKGYKTFAKASRALDKKASLPCTVVLVSSHEAEALLSYFAARPELQKGVEVVVTAASAKAAPARVFGRGGGALGCRLVVGGIDAAVAAVRSVATGAAAEAAAGGAASSAPAAKQAKAANGGA